MDAKNWQYQQMVPNYQVVWKKCMLSRSGILNFDLFLSCIQNDARPPFWSLEAAVHGNKTQLPISWAAVRMNS